MDYFASKSPKSPTAGASPPDPGLVLMNSECAKTLLPWNIFGWCRCLAILGQKETYILCFLALPPPYTKNVPAPLRKLIFIDVTNKFSIKKIEILLAT